MPHINNCFKLLDIVELSQLRCVAIESSTDCIWRRNFHWKSDKNIKNVITWVLERAFAERDKNYLMRFLDIKKPSMYESRF